jgi:hypothetical protein
MIRFFFCFPLPVPAVLGLGLVFLPVCRDGFFLTVSALEVN